MKGFINDDLLFKTDERVFSYRVGGILIKDGKILLQRLKSGEYSVIGGHARYMETSAETLRREFFEELGVKIKVNSLIATAEIFFPWDENRNTHQIAMYYGIELDGDTLPEAEIFSGFDELGGKRVDLDFCWVELTKLTEPISFYPAELIPVLLSPSAAPVHFISKQI